VPVVQVVLRRIGPLLGVRPEPEPAETVLADYPVLSE
jgi:hypothetical protein